VMKTILMNRLGWECIKVKTTTATRTSAAHKHAKPSIHIPQYISSENKHQETADYISSRILSEPVALFRRVLGTHRHRISSAEPKPESLPSGQLLHCVTHSHQRAVTRRKHTAACRDRKSFGAGLVSRRQESLKAHAPPPNTPAPTYMRSRAGPRRAQRTPYEIYE
jgi:hypothetical protein